MILRHAKDQEAIDKIRVPTPGCVLESSGVGEN